MNRYLVTAPAQYEINQMRQTALARFGSILDLNEVDNGDGTKSLAVYLNTPAAGGTVTAWRNDVAAVVYAPDPTPGNQATLQTRVSAALTANAAFLAVGSPTNAQTLAQVQRLTKESNALIRLLLGQLADISDTA